MDEIVLSADSTCDLNADLKRKYDVHYYPFHILYRGNDYLDNVDIHPQDLYDGYYEDGSLPSTSAINVAEYLDYFSSFVEAGKKVVHINLGGAISSAHENAKTAASKLSGVYVIDSRNLSTGIAHLVIRAGELIERGWDAAYVAGEVEALRPHVHSSFVLGTLDFMAAGGRCPAVLAHVGHALSFKTEILVNNADGSMGLGRIYRGKMPAVLRKYVRKTIEAHPDIVCENIFITHSGIEKECIEVVKDEIGTLLPEMKNIYVTTASCTISSHCGPGTLGILFVTES